MRLRPDRADQRFIRRLLLVVLVGSLVFFAWKVSDLLLLAFGASLGAVLLDNVADFVAERTPLPRGAGLLIGTLLLLGVIGAIGTLFATEIGTQTGALMHELPRDWASLQMRLGQTPLGKLLLDQFRSWSSSGTVGQIVARLGFGSGEVLVNFILIIIGAIFFAASPGIYRHGLVLLTPPTHRVLMREALDDTGEAIKLWLITQLISMALMGAMIAFGLWLSGLDGWGALGVLGGLSEFIPYVGPTLAMMPAIVVALAAKGSIWGVLGTYALVRIFQANIITPLISQRVVKVPPGLYLFGIIATGFAFGTFGMFFSGALVVAAYTLIRRLYLDETLGEAVPPPGER